MLQPRVFRQAPRGSTVDGFKGDHATLRWLRWPLLLEFGVEGILTRGSPHYTSPGRFVLWYQLCADAPTSLQIKLESWYSQYQRFVTKMVSVEPNNFIPGV